MDCHARAQSARTAQDIAASVRNQREGGRSISESVSDSAPKIILSTLTCSLMFDRGFVEEGRMRKSNWVAGKWDDIIFMSILEDEWDIETGKPKQKPGVST